jgi:hypothetical protein
MTITICPIALQGTGKCWDAQCRLRHDVVLCKPCKCFVLHCELRKHRSGKDHRLKSGFGDWKAETRRRAILPSPYPQFTKPKPKPSEKRARRLAKKKELAGTGGVPARGGEAKRARKVAKKKEPTGTGVPARGGEAQHLSVSGEEGLDFKSEVGVGGEKTNRTIPVIIQKTAAADGVGLTLVGMVVTGAGSGG